MSCNDVCVVMDYDCCNEFYRDGFRHARKEHRCCECGETIAKGSYHHHATGKAHGEFWENRTCSECHEIRVVFSCDGWVFGELWESVDDQLFSRWDEMKAIDCLSRLTTQSAIDKMRGKYAEYRREWGDEAQ